MSFPFISGDPTTVDDALPKAKLGGLYQTSDGRVWRYVKVVGTAGTLAAGQGVVWSNDADGYSVTKIAASALTVVTVARSAGVAQGAITTGQYGYVLVRGKGTALGDGSVAVGQYIVTDGGTSPTATFDTMAAGEEMGVVGQALDNDTGSPTNFNAQLWIA